MKSKNQYIYSDNEEVLKSLEEDYVLLGRGVKREPGRLTVYALPRRNKKKSKKRSR